MVPWRTRFPRLDAYLARLPDGVDSYPDVVVKAATFTAAFADRPVPVEPGEVPEPILRVVQDPPPVSAWIPEVHMISVFKIIGDHHFEGRGGTPAFLEWLHGQNQKLLGGRLYRMLFWLIEPESIFRGVERRWGAFRRGTTLRILERDAESCRVELGFAPRLFDEEGMLSVGVALRAAGEAAGATEVDIELAALEETRGELAIRWVL